jgi:hypothetical protein
MRTIISLIAITVAGAIFFLYTKPTYDSIQTTQAQIAQYNAALDKATQLQALKQTLLSRYNAFNPTDLARLQTLLPDQVNNIGLILDLDTLANKFGLSLENVNIGSSNAGSSSSGSADSAGATGSPGNTATIGASATPYDSLDVTFTIHATYAQFMQYISNLETSLRIVDLIGLSVGGASAPAPSAGITASTTGSDNIVYTFNITLRTYWLKQ